MSRPNWSWTTRRCSPTTIASIRRPHRAARPPATHRNTPATRACKAEAPQLPSTHRRWAIRIWATASNIRCSPTTRSIRSRRRTWPAIWSTTYPASSTWTAHITAPTSASTPPPRVWRQVYALWPTAIIWTANTEFSPIRISSRWSRLDPHLREHTTTAKAIGNDCEFSALRELPATVSKGAAIFAVSEEAAFNSVFGTLLGLSSACLPEKNESPEEFRVQMMAVLVLQRSL